MVIDAYVFFAEYAEHQRLIDIVFRFIYKSKKKTYTWMAAGARAQ